MPASDVSVLKLDVIVYLRLLGGDIWLWHYTDMEDLVGGGNLQTPRTHWLLKKKIHNLDPRWGPKLRRGVPRDQILLF